ncbi:MAG: hypothetical protein U0R44_01270 [Candidatus Micrarchaeia archaeon]
MSAISDFLSSAFSELFYDREPALGQTPVKQPPAEEMRKSIKRRGYESIPESISQSGSLAEFDRILGMLESGDTRTKAKAIGALDQISDDNRISCVAIFSKNQEARKAAMNKVKGKPSLLNIIFFESLFRDSSSEALDQLASMMEELKDQRSFCTLACNHRDRKTRMKALASITDVKWLLELAYSSRFEDTRWQAIERLKDMRVDIDREDLRHDDTLSVIADQLVKSSLEEGQIVEDMEILLENVRYLDNLSRTEKSNEFIDIIRDNVASYYGTIRSIATSSRHKKAREIAVKGMSGDSMMLAEIAQHSEYEDTAEMAIDSIASAMGSRTEPQCLALVASMSSDSEKRSKAVARLDNVQTLKHVVKYSVFEDSRIGAAHRLASMVNQLEDPEALRLVIAYARDSKNRELAEAKIIQLDGREASRPAVKPEPAPAKEAKKPEPEKKAEPQKPEAALRRHNEADYSPGAGSGGGGIWGAIKELIGI